MKLLITDQHFLPKDLNSRLHELAMDATVYEGQDQPVDASSYVMAFGGHKFKQWDIEAFENLKFIQLSMAGYNHLPTQLWLNRKITLANARDVFSEPMAEWVIFYILMHVKQGKLHLQQQAQKIWQRQMNGELENQSAIIYGSGSIGQAIAKRLKAFNVHTTGVNSNGRKIEPFNQCVAFKDSKAALAKADIVIMTLPLTEQTQGAFDASYVHTIKEGAIFLNVGRGHIVDEQALITALKQHTIAFAALDVMDQEPLPEDHPFWTMDNVCITPHDSGTSEITSERLWNLLRENTQRFVNKKTLLHQIED